jgi:hypothetical protein
MRKLRLRPEELGAGVAGILPAGHEKPLRSQLVRQHVVEERTAASTR